MNLWFRLLHLLLCSLFRPKLEAPFGVSRLQFRVLPNDLDSNLHMTNGRYWNIFDLGRLDLILRMGLGRGAAREVGADRRRRHHPVPPRAEAVPALHPETRLVGWVGSRGIMEQRVLIGAEQKIATRALLVTGIYDRPRAPVPGHAEDDGSDRRGRPRRRRRSVRPPRRCWPPMRR
jgi:hypothetical protein